MALANNELFSSRNFSGRPRMVVERNKVGTFAASAAAATTELPVGTPIAFNTSINLWVPYTQGGSNGSNVIRGFVAHKAVTLAATGGGEVQGVVMLEGEIHRDDVNTAALRAILATATGVTAPTEGELDTALKAQLLRELSLHVRGLAGVS